MLLSVSPSFLFIGKEISASVDAAMASLAPKSDTPNKRNQPHCFGHNWNTYAGQPRGPLIVKFNRKSCHLQTHGAKIQIRSPSKLLQRYHSVLASNSLIFPPLHGVKPQAGPD